MEAEVGIEPAYADLQSGPELSNYNAIGLIFAPQCVGILTKESRRKPMVDTNCGAKWEPGEGIPLDSPEGQKFKEAMVEHLTKFHADFSRSVAEGFYLKALGIPAEEVTQEMVDEFCKTIGPHISVSWKPNPNYVPPSMEGLDENGWPLK